MANTFRPSGISINIRQDLVEGASRSGTTLVIDPIITKDGHRVIMSDIGDICYAKLDQGTNNEEIISFTGLTDNTTTYTLSGCVWGYNFYDTEGSVVANQKKHVAGGTLLITNDDHFLSEQFVTSDTPTAGAAYTPSSGQQLTTYDFVTTREGYWDGAVDSFTDLPIGAIEGEARVTLDTGKIYVWDIVETTTATISSVDTGTNIVTFAAAHGLSTGDYCYFVGGFLPTGLSVDTGYYVYVDTTTSLHVSASKAGATVDITASGSGTIRQASWVLAGAGGGAGTVYVEALLGSAGTTGNTVFTFTNGGSWTETKYLQVYVNGVLQEEGASADYTASDDTNTMTFNTAVEDTDKVTLLVVSIDLYNPAWGTVTSSIIPDTTDTYDIGSDTKRFKDGYFEGDVDIDGTLNVEGTSTLPGYSKTKNTLTSGETIAGATLPVAVFSGSDNYTLSAKITQATQNGAEQFYSDIWKGQTFTTDASTNRVTSITVQLSKTSSPTGYVNLSIYAVDGSDKPTGSALGTATVATSLITTAAKHDFEFSSAVELDTSTTYAIVVNLPSNDSSNYISIYRTNATTYSGGGQVESTDGGSSWGAISSTSDFLFYVYGGYEFTEGNIYSCDANDVDKTDFLGFATTTATATNDIIVQGSGTVSGFTGLEEGKYYYVDNDKLLSLTPGDYPIMVGMAISETQIFIKKDNYNLTCQAGDYLIFEEIANVQPTSFIYTKAFDATVYCSGRIRVMWETEPGTTGAAPILSKVYVDGSPVGTERSTADGSQWTEDIQVKAGQVVAMYHKKTNAGASGTTPYSTYMKIGVASYIGAVT